MGDDDAVGMPGGMDWTGDDDNEYIFGTMWLDNLYGNGGDDIMYGFEGDDTMVGGYGIDRLFGDAGDDTIFLGDTPSPPPATVRPEFVDAGLYGEALVPTVEPSYGTD